MTFREYVAKSGAARRVVQHPGSRGGHPWWDGHEWRYDAQPQERVAGGQYRADPSGPPTDDRRRVWEAIRDAKPLGPHLREERRRIEEYGYQVEESTGIATEPLAVRKATFRELLSAIEALHRAFPRLTELIRSTGLKLVVSSRIEHWQAASGVYFAANKSRGPLIVIDGSSQFSPGHTLAHELGHAIDNALAQRGESARVGTTRGASELPGHPVRTLVSKMKKTDEHKQFVRTLESYEPGSRSYNTMHSEVFARAFNALVQHEYSRRGADPASRLAQHDFYEEYTPEQLDSFGAELRGILKLYGLEKSLRRFPPGYSSA